MHGKSRSNHGISLRVCKLRFRIDKYTRRYNLTNIPAQTFMSDVIVTSAKQLRLHFLSILLCVSLESHKWTEPQIQAPWFTSHPITPHIPRQETHLKGCFLQIHPQSPSTPSGSEQDEIFPSILALLPLPLSLTWVSSCLCHFKCSSCIRFQCAFWVLSIRYILLINFYSCCIQMVKCFSFFTSCFLDSRKERELPCVPIETFDIIPPPPNSHVILVREYVPLNLFCL